MQVQPIQNYSQLKQTQNLQFKSVYPVRVWVREMGGGYAPVATRDLSKTIVLSILI